MLWSCLFFFFFFLGFDTRRWTGSEFRVSGFGPSSFVFCLLLGPCCWQQGAHISLAPTSSAAEAALSPWSYSALLHVIYLRSSLPHEALLIGQSASTSGYVNTQQKHDAVDHSAAVEE